MKGGAMKAEGRLILVCGGRDFTDARRIADVLREYLPTSSHEEPSTVLTGGARGADEIAGQQAFQLGFEVESMPANWVKHGKAAGPIRNQQMLDRKPDLVIAFPGGKGTADMVARAERAGVPVRRGLEPKAEADNPNPVQEGGRR